VLGIFDSHPVQYRAPVYRELELLAPGAFQVFYATDISLRGNPDQGFGQQIAWDESLLEGYSHTILQQLTDEKLQGRKRLHGRGINEVFSRHPLTAVLQTQFLYEYDMSVLLHARRRGLPVWIRQETQDEAFHRGGFKGLLRSFAYRLLYSQVNHAFPIGLLNREHLLTHGVSAGRMTPAPYCTPDRFASMSDSQQATMRTTCRAALGIAESATVIGFFGKLIPKKDPSLILEALSLIPQAELHHLEVLFVGSGELEAELRAQALLLKEKGVPVHFAGFINQSRIASYYAATDLMVLPSRRMGETWGLVVNEALQAGCSVAISEAAGCAVEFGTLPHVAVFPSGDASALSHCIRRLIATPPEHRNWARAVMDRYSCRAAAEGIASKLL
jgi:glycosyltransferase involved in cell wall biosynthesis